MSTNQKEKKTRLDSEHEAIDELKELRPRKRLSKHVGWIGAAWRVSHSGDVVFDKGAEVVPTEIHVTHAATIMWLVDDTVSTRTVGEKGESRDGDAEFATKIAYEHGLLGTVNRGHQLGLAHRQCGCALSAGLPRNQVAEMMNKVTGHGPSTRPCVDDAAPVGVGMDGKRHRGGGGLESESKTGERHKIR